MIGLFGIVGMSKVVLSKGLVIVLCIGGDWHQASNGSLIASERPVPFLNWYS